MNLFKEDIKLGFRDLDFEGFRLYWENDDMPWANKEERESYLDNLVNEGSEYSSSVYKRLFKQMNYRDIHIKISRSFIAKGLSVLLMSIAIIMIIKGVTIAGLAILGFSFIFRLINKYLIRRANELYIGLKTGPSIIDLMFANRETL